MSSSSDYDSDSSDSDSDGGDDRILHEQDIRAVILNNGVVTLDNWEDYIVNNTQAAEAYLLNIYMPTSLYNKIIKDAKGIIGRKSKNNITKFPYSFFLNNTDDINTGAAQTKAEKLRLHFTSQFQNYFSKRGINKNLKEVQHKICEDMNLDWDNSDKHPIEQHPYEYQVLVDGKRKILRIFTGSEDIDDIIPSIIGRDDLDVRQMNVDARKQATSTKDDDLHTAEFSIYNLGMKFGQIPPEAVALSDGGGLWHHSSHDLTQPFSNQPPYVYSMGEAGDNGPMRFFISERYEHQDLLQLLIDWCHDFLDHGERAEVGWAAKSKTQNISQKCWGFQKKLKIQMTTGTKDFFVEYWDINAEGGGAWDEGRLISIYVGTDTLNIRNKISKMAELREGLFSKKGCRVSFFPGLMFNVPKGKAKFTILQTKFRDWATTHTVANPIQENGVNMVQYVFRATQQITMNSPISDDSFHLCSNEKHFNRYVYTRDDGAGNDVEFPCESATIKFTNVNSKMNGYGIAHAISKNMGIHFNNNPMEQPADGSNYANGSDEQKEANVQKNYHMYPRRVGGGELTKVDMIAERNEQAPATAITNKVDEELPKQIHQYAPTSGLFMGRSVRDAGGSVEFIPNILAFPHNKYTGMRHLSNNANAVWVRFSPFSSKFDPAKGAEVDPNMPHDYLGEFTRAPGNKFFTEQAKHLPEVFVPYQYVYWGAAGNPVQAPTTQLKLKAIILLKVELYFRNDRYDKLQKQTERFFNLNKTSKRTKYGEEMSIYNLYTFYVFPTAYGYDNLEKCYTYIKTGGGTPPRIYRIAQCDKSPGVGTMFLQSMTYSCTPSKARGLLKIPGNPQVDTEWAKISGSSPAEKRKKKDVKRIKIALDSQNGYDVYKKCRSEYFKGEVKDDEGWDYIPFIYNEDSWGAITMELGYTIFDDLILQRGDDPYKDKIPISWTSVENEDAADTIFTRHNDPNILKINKLNDESHYYSKHQFSMMFATTWKTFGDKFRFFDAYIFINSFLETNDTFLCKIALMGGCKVFFIYKTTLTFIGPNYSVVGDLVVAVDPNAAISDTCIPKINVDGNNVFKIWCTTMRTWLENITKFPDNDPFNVNRPKLFQLISGAAWDDLLVTQDIIYKIYFIILLFYLKENEYKNVDSLGDFIQNLYFESDGLLSERASVSRKLANLYIFYMNPIIADTHKPMLIYNLNYILDSMLKILYPGYEVIDINFGSAAGYRDPFNFYQGLKSGAQKTVSNKLDSLYKHCKSMFEKIYPDAPDSLKQQIGFAFGEELKYEMENDNPEALEPQHIDYIRDGIDVLLDEIFPPPPPAYGMGGGGYEVTVSNSLEEVLDKQQISSLGDITQKVSYYPLRFMSFLYVNIEHFKLNSKTIEGEDGEKHEIENPRMVLEINSLCRNLKSIQDCLSEIISNMGILTIENLFPLYLKLSKKLKKINIFFDTVDMEMLGFKDYNYFGIDGINTDMYNQINIDEIIEKFAIELESYYIKYENINKEAEAVEEFEQEKPFLEPSEEDGIDLIYLHLAKLSAQSAEGAVADVAEKKRKILEKLERNFIPFDSFEVHKNPEIVAVFFNELKTSLCHYVECIGVKMFSIVEQKGEEVKQDGIELAKNFYTVMLGKNVDSPPLQNLRDIPFVYYSWLIASKAKYNIHNVPDDFLAILNDYLRDSKGTIVLIIDLCGDMYFMNLLTRVITTEIDETFGNFRMVVELLPMPDKLKLMERREWKKINLELKDIGLLKEMEFDWEKFIRICNKEEINQKIGLEYLPSVLTYIARQRHIKISIDSYMEFILKIFNIIPEHGEHEIAASLAGMLLEPGFEEYSSVVGDDHLLPLGELSPVTHRGGGKNKTKKVYIKRSKKVTRSKNRKYKNKTKKTFRMKKKKKSRKRNKK